MNWRWISIAALLAAVVIGLGALTGGDSGTSAPSEVLSQPSYYLKDAVITETQPDGSPKIRLIANRIEQAPADDSITLHTVRVDYLQVPDKRWLLSADEGFVPPDSRTIQFTGNVELHPSDGPPGSYLRTDALNIDTDKNIAYTTKSPVAIRFGDHTVQVRRLEADLTNEKLKLESVHGRFNSR
ncbi:MAG TPA: LPS export ABC transporter periplasmic protein LptC [Steroidobacteraceae bacterium]|jgi:LPS export ABC transporter protein LptC